jgi:hypothetical protein
MQLDQHHSAILNGGDQLKSLLYKESNLLCRAQWWDYSIGEQVCMSADTDMVCVFVLK